MSGQARKHETNETVSRGLKHFIIVQLPNVGFFIVLVVCVVVTWITALPWFLLAGSDGTSAWRFLELAAGYCLTILATMFISWGTLSISRHRAEGREIGRASNTTLVTTGAYRHCRHPITLGFCLATPGCALVFDFVPLFLTTLLYTPLMLGLLLYEEKELASRFGEVYMTYKSVTPMLFPTGRLGKETGEARETTAAHEKSDARSGSHDTARGRKDG